MSKPIIYLLSIAGSDRDLASQLGLPSSRALVDFIQDVVGADYRVRANLKLIKTPIDDRRGGRSDDSERVAELDKVFSNDNVTAVLSLRGGAWLARILPQVSFDRLKKRKKPLHVFGFSELTTLVNIMAGYAKVRAYYDVAPGFLLWGLRNYATANYDELLAGLDADDKLDAASKRGFALGWAKAFFNLELVSQIVDTVDIIEGNGTDRRLRGELVRGKLKATQDIKVIGGCLSILPTLLGSPFAKSADPGGRWLALEDIREYPYRIDRYLAQLKLAGAFERCAGLLLGDFHLDSDDQTDVVLNLLKHHLPPRRQLPIIARCNFGHCYPAAPLPLNRSVRLERGRGREQNKVSLLWS